MVLAKLIWEFDVIHQLFNKAWPFSEAYFFIFFVTA